MTGLTVAPGSPPRVRPALASRRQPGREGLSDRGRRWAPRWPEQASVGSAVRTT